MEQIANRRAIRSLRLGVVPSSHVLDLTVGIDSLLSPFEDQIINLKSGNQTPVSICGEWGTGKSNLLSYLREYSLKRNIAVAYVNLNGNSVAVNHPQRFYHKIVEDLRLPGIQEKGIANFLPAIENSPFRKSATDKWASSNYYSSELAKAFWRFANEDPYQSHGIILGTDLSWSSYTYKKEKALRRIDDLGSYLKNIGFDGLMIQFDELETIRQLWNSRSRQSAYKILNELSCLPNVLTVFASTDRFNDQLYKDQIRISDDRAQKFMNNYSSKFPSLKPPVINKQLGIELLKRIHKLYQHVYPVSKEISINEIVDKWSQMSFNNPRRLIRHTIDFLDRQRPIKNNA